MTILKRKFTNKAGQVIIYEYDTKNNQTNAKLKREHLKKFVEEHQTELRELQTKKMKIDYIMKNIDNKYNYSYSMINKYI